MSVSITDSQGKLVNDVHRGSAMDLLDKWVEQMNTPIEDQPGDFDKAKAMCGTITRAMSEGESIETGLLRAKLDNPEFKNILEILGFLIRYGYLNPVPEDLHKEESPNEMVELSVTFNFKETG